MKTIVKERIEKIETIFDELKETYTSLVSMSEKDISFTFIGDFVRHNIPLTVENVAIATIFNRIRYTFDWSEFELQKKDYVETLSSLLKNNEFKKFVEVPTNYIVSNGRKIYAQNVQNVLSGKLKMSKLQYLEMLFNDTNKIIIQNDDRLFKEIFSMSKIYNRIPVSILYRYGETVIDNIDRTVDICPIERKIKYLDFIFNEFEVKIDNTLFKVNIKVIKEIYKYLKSMPYLT